MRIKVEFNIGMDPDDAQVIEMDGPDMDVEDLRESVLFALEEELGMDLPDDFELIISEIPSATIH